MITNLSLQPPVQLCPSHCSVCQCMCIRAAEGSLVRSHSALPAPSLVTFSTWSCTCKEEQTETRGLPGNKETSGNQETAEGAEKGTNPEG